MSSPATPTPREPAYTDIEDVALSRPWSHTSKSVQGMNFTVFWEHTDDSFKTKPEVFRARSATSLRSRWSVLQRVVQKYLGTVRMKFAMDGN